MTLMEIQLFRGRGSDELALLSACASLKQSYNWRASFVVTRISRRMNGEIGTPVVEDAQCEKELPDHLR